jgi:hypothetical protein
MKTVFSCIFLMVTLQTSVLTAQKHASSDLTADLIFLNRVLQDGHPATLHKAINLDTLIAASKLKDSVTRFEYRQSIGAALHATGCIHTAVLNNPLAKPLKHFFPLAASVFQEKVYVVGAQDSLLIGTEILAVNDVSTQKILQSLRTFYATDGPGNAYPEGAFNVHSSLLITGYFQGLDSYKITTPDSSFILKADTVARKSHVLVNTFKPMLQKGKCTLSVHKNVALMKVTNFKKQDIKVYKQMMQSVQKMPEIEHFILDLRGNGGGARKSAAALAGHFVPKKTEIKVIMPKKTHLFKHLSNYSKGMFVFSKFFYTKDIFRWRKTKDGLSVKSKYKTRNPKFKGQLYVLCDGLTASSSTTCMTFLKNQLPVRFIGTTTGGSMGGNYGGAFPSFVLPKSKIKIRVPAYYLTFDGGLAPFSPAIPDYIVPQNPRDTKARKDTALEFTLRELIKI